MTTKPQVSAVRPTRSIPPAWKFLVAAAFLSYYAVMIYSELYQPGQTGIDPDFRDGVMRIREVSSTTAASRAGLRSGDLLRTVDGWPIRTWEDWRHFRATREVGRRYSFEIERAGARSAIPVVLARQPGDPLASLERKRYVQGALLVLALILLFFRTREPATRFAAWLLASIGTAPLFPEAEMTAIWRGLPTSLGLLLWIPQVSHLMMLPIFFTFFGSMPSPLFKGKWPWLIAWLPAFLLVAWASPLLYAHVYHPPPGEELPAWMRFVLGLAVILYGGGGLAAFLFNFRRLLLPQERLRFRALAIGAVIGLSPLILFLAAIFWGTLTQSSIVWFFVSDPYRHSLAGLFLAFPLSLAYAIFRHRVLRVPVMTGSAS